MVAVISKRPMVEHRHLVAVSLKHIWNIRTRRRQGKMSVSSSGSGCNRSSNCLPPRVPHWNTSIYVLPRTYFSSTGRQNRGRCNEPLGRRVCGVCLNDWELFSYWICLHFEERTLSEPSINANFTSLPHRGFPAVDTPWLVEGGSENGWGLAGCSCKSRGERWENVKSCFLEQFATRLHKRDQS